MKKLFVFCLSSVALVADPESVPSTAVVVSTETVTKTVAREPRIVVFIFDDFGAVSTTEVNYETTIRLGSNVVSRAPFKSVSLNWAQVTNASPAMTTALEQFKAAAKASMTNSP